MTFKTSGKARFVELLLSCGVLRFGAFKTKSGRESPFFFDMGLVASGMILGEVAEIYAKTILDTFGDSVTCLFGPAYKGIPLCVMTAERMVKLSGRDMKFAFNRKEAKDHGEKGVLVGHACQSGDRIVIVEDVITGGTSINESMALLKPLKVELVGLLVGIDRQERGQGGAAALAEVAAKYNLNAQAIITLAEIVDLLHNREVQGRVWIDDQLKARIDAYARQYGIR